MKPLPAEARRGLLWTSIGLLLATLWLFEPALSQLSQVIIGDPQTDAVRGAWGFSHLGQSVLSGEAPWNSSRVNFPYGARLMILPLASGLLVSPLGVLDPVFAYNIILIALVFVSGLATAWLTRVISDSWLAGFVAGTILISQPMLHHALADGTAEHITLWAVPLFIGASWLALADQNPRWGIGAGLLSIVVALDSPYHGLYALVLGVSVLPFAIKTVRGRERDLWRALSAMVASALLGIGFVYYLYKRFEAGEVDGLSTSALQASNSTDMRLWWRHMGGADGLRDISQPPTLVPTGLFIGSIILAAFGRKKAAPWLGAGILMVGLSFGTRENTPELMGAWLGAPAAALSDLILTFNAWFYSLPIAGEIRFPRRWLVPAALSLAVAGGVGLHLAFQRWIRPTWARIAVASVLGGLTLQTGVSDSRLHNPFPMHELPEIIFTTAISESQSSGAVLLLPATRSVQAGVTREKLPVFANLSSALASADDLYIQMKHNKPMVSFPSLQTLSAVPREQDVRRVLRDWSDLSLQKSMGRGIPPSAYEAGGKSERDRGIRVLRQAGLRWIAVDLGAYEDTGLSHLRDQLGKRVVREQTFDEGDGVLLLELSPSAVLLTPTD